MAARRLDVTQLFDAYVDAREVGQDPELESLLAQAGPAAEELRARVDVYESLQGIGQELRGEEHLEGNLGRYEIRSTVGEGGLGTVYLAWDPELGRDVALKVLMRDAGLGKRERGWALNEARALARLKHHNVVEVFAVEKAEGRDFIAMEHVPGPSLGEVVAELRRMRDGTSPTTTEAANVARALEPFSKRVTCLEQIAAALAYCHDRGVLHRDVKPSNVLFDQAGEPRLIDFGLAHHAGEESRMDITRRLVGTPAYVAPEQVSNQRTGAEPRSDQFSFGTMAYELLALENPFLQETHTATLSAVERAELRRLRKCVPAVSKDLERVVHHCMEVKPEHRYADMAAVAADLRAIGEHRPVSVEAASLTHVLRLWTRRERKRILFVSATALLAIGLFVGQRLNRAIADRSQLDAALEGLRLAEVRAPADFRRTYSTLQSQRAVAERLDRATLHQWLYGSARESVGGRIEEWSEHLATTLRAALTQSKEQSTSFQHREWDHIVSLEEQLCPECEANTEYRNRGRVEFDLGEFEGHPTALFEIGPLHPMSILRTVGVPRRIASLDYPRVGVYRLVVLDPNHRESVVTELQFVTSRDWQPLRQIQPRRRDEELFARSVRVRATHHAPGDSLAMTVAGLPEQIRLPSFRILPDPVRRDDVRRFLLDARPDLDDVVFLGGSEATPAWISLELAREFAEWAGGRLPSAEELWTAIREGQVAEPVVSLKSTGEWLALNSFPPTERTHTVFKYVQFPTAIYPATVANLIESHTTPSARVEVDGKQAYVHHAFRIAFTTEAAPSPY